MYLPSVDTERDTLCNYLEMQLTALRASALGLDDEQAARSPLRSELSIAGILSHCTYVITGALVGAGRREPAEADFHDSFRPAAPLAEVMRGFEQVIPEYLQMCREGDLDAVMPVGPFPWYGLDEARPAALRYLYVHHVEEFARHAGHADLIREEMDGAKAAELLATLEGRPENEFVKPWSPS